MSGSLRDWFARSYRNRVIGFRLVIGHDYPVDSLAVLPFTGSRNDTNGRKFVDSICEDVINRLSQRYGPRVTPFSAVSGYSDQTNVFDIGRQLGVQGVAVVNINLNPKPGTVYFDERVQIDIRVFDVRHNKAFTGLVFDAKQEDVDRIETEIVKELSKKLEVDQK